MDPDPQLLTFYGQVPGSYHARDKSMGKRIRTHTALIINYLQR